MIQKSHGDESLYKRKPKHKNQHDDDDYDWYPDNYESVKSKYKVKIIQ